VITVIALRIPVQLCKVADAEKVTDNCEAHGLCFVFQVTAQEHHS
jgi:hypothetical protein